MGKDFGLKLLCNKKEYKEIGEKKQEKAPDQNRTDTSSLEGYGSTIELQAHKELLKGTVLSLFFSSS